MAGFQTSIFRDGHWVTTTVSTQEALDATARLDASRALPEQTQAPRCGILTRTVVPSPVTHWILPIRIRSKSRIDVAFVGSHAVQISELRRDGQLINVTRKNDFGSRICNAVVMGDTPNTPKDIIGGDQASIKIEDAMASDGASPPTNSYTRRRVLPPQILVLFLENGLLLFLFLSQSSDSTWKFEMMHYQTPWAIKNLGFRLAIDPTSRYIAAASSQKAFAIWELESRENIEAQYEKHGFFNPLKPGEKPGETVNVVRSFQGTLFHLEFLFPRPEDVDHIILMMVVARRDCHDGPVASRVLTFDWIAGEDLGSTIEGDCNGIRLPELYNMPLMIIPLRFKNSLCVVSEHSIGVIKNAISGSMTCDDLMTERPQKTDVHYGAAEPLWAAWARPIRGDWYCKNTDIIMLAREDGYLVHIEVDAANVVPSVTSAGSLGSTISTGFAMPYIDDADAIIVSGDSSPGGTWKLSPRDDPVRASTLRNWSPVVDITAAPFVAPAAPTRITSATRRPKVDAQVLVGASGRGTNGNLASFRWGRQARIGMDVDIENTFPQFSAFVPPDGESQLLHIALSLPGVTVVLQFNSDYTKVHALSADETSLDLLSRTIQLRNIPGQLIQVTEASITLVKGNRSTRQLLEDQGIYRAEHAVCTTDHVALSSLAGSGSAIHIYRVGSDGIALRGNWHVDGEVTCLATISRPELPDSIVVGALVDGHPWLSWFTFDGRLISGQAVVPHESSSTQHTMSDNAFYDGYTSMYILDVNEDGLTLMVGTLWGRIITVDVSAETGMVTVLHTRRLGKSAARLFSVTPDGSSHDLAVSCDDHLILLCEYDTVSRKHKGDPMIIPMSDGDAARHFPPVQWMVAAPKELQFGSSSTPLLLMAGSRLLIAELTSTTSLIPRSIPVDGTPTKVIYSDMWKCYIVAVSGTKDDHPIVKFVDPSTGQTISQLAKSARDSLKTPQGLGVQGDRIMCMEEWAFIKDDKLFPYVLVGLESGILLTLSMRTIDADIDSGATRIIEFWTRHKRKGQPGDSVYAIHGVSDGIVHCTGTTVFFDILETQEKKLREVSRYPLDSPALSLQVRDGKLFVLTARHSLLILDHRPPRQNHPVGQMSLLHADKATRSAIHMMPMLVPSAEHPSSSITMLSDASGNVVGVWTAVGKKEQPLEAVFRAVLPAPIRRFVQGSCRAPWYEPKEPGKFGTICSTKDGTDTFGVSLDGALYHFMILTEELWQLLHFLQFHAERTPELSPAACLRGRANSDDDGERGRHIDGDLMARCLRSRGIEGMMALPEVRNNLFGLLDRVETGALTRDFKEDAEHEEKYFDLVYRILEYLDTPVI